MAEYIIQKKSTCLRCMGKGCYYQDGERQYQDGECKAGYVYEEVDLVHLLRTRVFFESDHGSVKVRSDWEHEVFKTLDGD